MITRVAVLLCLAAAPFGFAQKKNEVAELNREIGLLRDDLQTMQQKMNDNIADLKAAIQSTLEQISATNRNVAALNKAMQDKFKDQDTNLRQPIGLMGNKVDSMADDFRNLKESVADLSARITKIQQQIADLDTVVRTIQKPPEPPPPAVDPNTPPPNVNAQSLWDGANRDMTGGNYDLALGEFTDYLKYFPGLDHAQEAQFNIGRIYFQQEKFEDAVKAFDAVLEKYPTNRRTSDARFMKGKALVKLDRRDDAAKEFRAVIARERGTDIADQAQEELKKLGLHPTAGNTKRSGRK